jgi:hypothetical protein
MREFGIGLKTKIAHAGSQSNFARYVIFSPAFEGAATETSFILTEYCREVSAQ